MKKILQFNDNKCNERTRQYMFRVVRNNNSAWGLDKYKHLRQMLIDYKEYGGDEIEEIYERDYRIGYATINSTSHDE